MPKPRKSASGKQTKPTKRAAKAARSAPAGRTPTAAKRARRAAKPTSAAPSTAAPPAAPVPEATAASQLQTLRMNCKHVLDALFSETGANGGDAAAPRVLMFRESPTSASNETFAFVSMLKLRRWYVAQEKPNKTERDSLWLNVRRRMGLNAATPNPEGWDGSSEVSALQDIAAETP